MRIDTRLRDFTSASRIVSGRRTGRWSSPAATSSMLGSSMMNGESMITDEGVKPFSSAAEYGTA